MNVKESLWLAGRLVTRLGLAPNLKNYRGIVCGTQETIPQNFAGTGKSVSILRADLGALHPGKAFEAGAWVVTLQTEVTFAPGAQCNPLIGRISMGDGAQAQVVEVDIGRGACFQVPCGTIEVSARLDAPPAGFVAPTSQIVRVGVHRGFSSAPITRTFYFVSGAAPVAANILVPPQSIYLNAFGVAAEDPAALLQFNTGVGALLPAYSGAQARAAANMGTGLAIPMGALALGIVLPVTAAPTLNMIQFGLRL